MANQPNLYKGKQGYGKTNGLDTVIDLRTGFRYRGSDNCGKCRKRVIDTKHAVKKRRRIFHKSCYEGMFV